MRIWRMKHYDFSDFERIPEGVECKKNVMNYEQRVKVEELVSRLLDPLYEAWDNYCGYERIPRCGVGIKTGFLHHSICEQMPPRYCEAHVAYSAEVYPINGEFDAFVEFLQMYIESPLCRFDSMEVIPSEKCVYIVYKNVNREQRKIWKKP